MKKDESDEDLGRTRVVQVGDALSLLLQAQSLMVDSHSLRGIAENMAHRSRTLKKLAYDMDPELDPDTLADNGETD